MGSVEAAAGLFESSDSGSDFFTAPEGGNSAADSPTSATKVDDLFSSQDSSSLFDSLGDGAEMSSFFPMHGEAEHVGHDNLGGTQLSGSTAFSPHENNTYGYGDDGAGNYNGYEAQGWYDEYGQWHGHSQQNPLVMNGQDNYASIPSTDSYDYASNSEQYADYNANSSYAATSTGSSSAYEHGLSSTSVPTSVSRQPTYDPYKPAVPSVQQPQNTYSNASAAFPYDPYKPSVVNTEQVESTLSPVAATTSPHASYQNTAAEFRSVSGVTSSSASSYLSGNVIPPASALQPLKAPASPYRPSSFNAYDPPLPVVKPKRSATAHQSYVKPHSSFGTTSPASHSTFSPPGTSLLPLGPPSPPHSKPSVATSAPPYPSNSAYDPPSSSYHHAPVRMHAQEKDITPSVVSRPNGHVASSSTKKFEPYIDEKGQAEYHSEPGQVHESWNNYPSEHLEDLQSFDYEEGAADMQIGSLHSPHGEFPPNDECKEVATAGHSEVADSENVSNPFAPSSQYLPQQNSSGDPPIRERSMSNISSFSSSSAASHDPYSPAQAVKRNVPPSFSGDNYGISSVPPVPSNYSSFTPMNVLGRVSLESSYSPPPVSGPYAPSPSLLGTNDPLGRASAKVPVVSFGFGGKLVTCFHSPPILNTGFDVALSSWKSTDVHICPLHEAVPESAFDLSSAAYPGPLFGDPGTPVAVLARSTTSNNAKSKTKKAKVLAYLDERAEEIQRGLGYLTSGSVDKRRADGKLALVRLLRVLVEHDGQLHESSAAETAARSAILPHLENSQDATGAKAFLNAPTGAARASGTFGSANSNEKPIAEYAVRPSTLETLQDFLLRGEKRKAYHYALDERLWAHAMVISSSVDKDAFKEVVSEFIRTELGVKAGPRADASFTNGFESLRLAYSLYSGQSSTAVQYLFPMKPLQLQTGPALTLQPPTPINHMTPLSPNFPPPSLATSIPLEILSQWQEYAVMLFSGQMGAESSSALTTLGDYLLSNDWVEAAHCCYLLSPQSSPIGGVGAPSVRIVLVGSQSPQRNPSFPRDPDSFIFSEIAEFALSLHVPAKGQEAFPGFPHLQVYRFVRALQLAEMGHIPLAKRYCEAITSAAFRPSPYMPQLFSEQLKEFFNRIIGDPELEKANSWISGKIAKPSLDGIGDWLGGTLSKFVAGEAETSSPLPGENHMHNNPAYTGAFSRYSNISSTNTSRGPSPVPSVISRGITLSSLPGRSGSAMAVRSVTNSYAPANRASSAMDYSRPDLRKNTPPPRVISADAGTTSFAHSQSFSQVMEGYGFDGTNSMGQVATNFASHPEDGGEQQASGWWSAAYGDANGVTPTATTFVKVDSQTIVTDSGSGFISLMDNYNSVTPSPSAAMLLTGSRPAEENDLDDDLGLGNSSKKKKSDSTEGTTNEDKPEEKKEERKSDAKPNSSSSGSWFGRWFGRSLSSSTPGPIKANLGEETTFYYDKELKRWVNKKAGTEPPNPAVPPPPPSRAQTTSPSRSRPMTHTGPPPPSPLPHPGRPLSAMDSGSTPPKRTLQRVRSNLIPEESTSSFAPPTPPAVMSSLTAPPPTGRPRSAAAKKNVRSRYVDVFQQEAS